jgi:hypothetical protein
MGMSRRSGRDRVVEADIPPLVLIAEAHHPRGIRLDQVRTLVHAVGVIADRIHVWPLVEESGVLGLYLPRENVKQRHESWPVVELLQKRIVEAYPDHPVKFRFECQESFCRRLVDTPPSGARVRTSMNGVEPDDIYRPVYPTRYERDVDV